MHHVWVRAQTTQQLIIYRHVHHGYDLQQSVNHWLKVTVEPPPGETVGQKHKCS